MPSKAQLKCVLLQRVEMDSNNNINNNNNNSGSNKRATRARTQRASKTIAWLCSCSCCVYLTWARTTSTSICTRYTKTKWTTTNQIKHLIIVLSLSHSFSFYLCAKYVSVCLRLTEQCKLNAHSALAFLLLIIFQLQSIQLTSSYTLVCQQQQQQVKE